jgi:hypothetical protein
LRAHLSGDRKATEQYGENFSQHESALINKFVAIGKRLIMQSALLELQSDDAANQQHQ